MHTAAYFENTSNAVLTRIAVVQDEVLTPLGGDRFLVPDSMTELAAAASLSTALTRAQIVAPSLERRRMNQSLTPLASAAVSFRLDNPQIYIPPRSLALDAGETVEFQTSEDDAGAVDQYGLIWLKPPGDLPPIPGGDIRRVRAVGDAVLVPNTWSSFAITLDNELEAGRYQLVNFVATGVSPIAARINFADSQPRPGLPAYTGADTAAALDASYESVKPISWYAMGEFSNTALPQIEYLATAADNAQEVFLDIVKVS